MLVADCGVFRMKAAQITISCWKEICGKLFIGVIRVICGKINIYCAPYPAQNIHPMVAREITREITNQVLEGVSFLKIW